MAKTRAQRKAERRAREERARRQGRRDGDAEARAQHDTQVPQSGEVAEAEAAMQSGITPEDLQAPAPSRAEVPAAEPAAPPEPEAAPAPAPAEAPPDRISRRERRRGERRARAEQKERAKRPRVSEAARVPARRERGRVRGFFASVIAELRRVQWPDRDTLVQASAVTLIFVAVMAAYLGGLDAIFNWLVQRIL